MGLEGLLTALVLSVTTKSGSVDVGRCLFFRDQQAVSLLAVGEVGVCGLGLQSLC